MRQSFILPSGQNSLHARKPYTCAGDCANLHKTRSRLVLLCGIAGYRGKRFFRAGIRQKFPPIVRAGKPPLRRFPICGTNCNKSRSRVIGKCFIRPNELIRPGRPKQKFICKSWKVIKLRKSRKRKFMAEFWRKKIARRRKISRRVVNESLYGRDGMGKIRPRHKLKFRERPRRKTELGEDRRRRSQEGGSWPSAESAGSAVSEIVLGRAVGKPGRLKGADLWHTFSGVDMAQAVWLYHFVIDMAQPPTFHFSLSQLQLFLFRFSLASASRFPGAGVGVCFISSKFFFF